MATKNKPRRRKRSGIRVLKLLKVRLDRSGCFEIRKEIVDSGGDKPLEWEMAYSIHGDYIGDVKVARALAKLGIMPELPSPAHTVCAVGYSAKEKKWFGWSHREIVGFKIGDMIFDERMPGATGKTPFVQDGTVPIKTLADAREAAVAFAAYVS